MATQADVRRSEPAETSPASAVLTSKWGGLNSRLLATIYPVDSAGARMPDTSIVLAPATDFNVELSGNWQSPFEQTGPESKIPALMGMLQSGTLESYATALLGKAADGDDSAGARLSREITEFSRTGQGRSGMTKLNSTQVFTGAPPVKFSFTLHFRAWDDPGAEVEEPIDQLVQWVLARDLAPNGNIISAIQSFKNGQGFLKALMPSESPQLVAINYAGRLFSPMVIEHIGLPQSVPRAADGRMLSASLQVSMATLTALDATDWRRAGWNQPTRLFNNET